MPGRHTNRGAKRAREARAELGLGETEPAGCLLTLVEERLRIPVGVALFPDAVAGCCWHDGGRTMLWINGRHAVVRRRFTLAHELGHVRCGHGAGVPVDTPATLGDVTEDARELEANAFAAELLMPLAGVEGLVGGEPTLEDVVRIAARYGVSAIAALYRLNALGLTRRYRTLRGELAEDLHLGVRERLAPEPYDDALARLGPYDLPRLSPLVHAGGLAAVMDGAASVGDVAEAAGVRAERLAGAVARIGA
jgi:Zn-dependent peptidase ImmA (M78 family)